jgi:uncharacterized protein (TIGR00645 family)
MKLNELISRLEKIAEEALFASRWLLAPIYLGLSVSLVLLLVIFMRELWHLASHLIAASESDVILGVLSLVDLSLTASLLIIVIFSGYENFVSQIDHSGHVDWPSWMGTIDFTALKLKLLSSIVAISAIQLLKEFMSMKAVAAVDERRLFWLVVIHLVFVASSVLLAVADYITGLSSGHGHDGAASGEALSSSKKDAGH